MRVIVVGAGFSGIGAARTLLQEGGDEVQVTLLEGGDRVGGRACTQDGREMGGTYWHGIYGNPLYEYALAQGITQPPHTREFRWGFLEPGQPGPMEQAHAEAVRETAHAYASVLKGCAGDCAAQSMGPLLREKFEEECRDGDAQKARSWRWRELVTRIASGAEAGADISTAWWAGAEDLPGPNFPCPIGFQGLAGRLAAGLDIRFRALVTRLQWGPDGVMVTCRDGTSFTADAVIMTVSLGVLKATHVQLFEPPLPSAKLRAMQGLTIGTVDKVFLDFTGSGAGSSNPPAWGNPVVAYHLLWDEPWDGSSTMDHPKASKGVPEWARGVFSIRFGGSEFKAPQLAHSNGCAAATAPAQHNRKGAADARLETFTGSAERVYGNSSRETGWTAQQHAAAGLPAAWPEHPSSAVLWITGEHARAMEACGEQELRAGVAALLAAFPAIPCPPGLPPPRVARSAWGSDSLFRGSYSYVNAGGSPDDIDALAVPLTAVADGGRDRPVVLFAGEATHRQLTGTMAGAFLTGQREARRLLAGVH